MRNHASTASTPSRPKSYRPRNTFRSSVRMRRLITADAREKSDPPVRASTVPFIAVPKALRGRRGDLELRSIDT